eukprot:3323492-Rhodomonas_salina.2
MRYMQPEFLDARRSEEHQAWAVQFRALYSAGPAMGTASHPVPRMRDAIAGNDYGNGACR